MNTKIITILFVVLITSCKPNHMQQVSNQEMADKTAINDLLVRYSYAVDFRDWTSYEQVFTKDAIIDYRAFGGPRTNVTEQVTYLKKALTHIESSQHTISTVLIELDGDTASVRSICHCPMVLKNEGREHTGFLLRTVV